MPICCTPGAGGCRQPLPLEHTHTLLSPPYRVRDLVGRHEVRSRVQLAPAAAAGGWRAAWVAGGSGSWAAKRQAVPGSGSGGGRFILLRRACSQSVAARRCGLTHVGPRARRGAEGSGEGARQ